ncbi:BURP domain-containing protein 12-like [Canna indica]|uniref:BURP domain-containing protein 12-like n=1 Tax=Canna indica TaxID=4628 RepID=A0AAQ3QB95_9LILI|nr:BURP domain-containing protein 12-like [Canna indica]
MAATAAPSLPFSFFFLCLLVLASFLFSSRPAHVAASDASAKAPNPFTARAALIRYWNRKVPTNRTQPAFLLARLSPLSALDSATFSSLAAGDPSALSPRLTALCAAARILCNPADSNTYSASARKDDSSAFASYQNSNFSDYGTDAAGGRNAFKSYSDNLNVPVDTFRRYSRDSVGHNDSFASYAPDGNVVTANFTSYASSATGGAGDFTSYDHEANVPNLKFTNYEAAATGRDQTFSSYSDDTNAGDQSFAGYGKNGNSVPTSFKSYANNSNVIGSSFSGYGESANGANDSFSSYGFNGNVPENNFRSYGSGGNSGSDRFTSYRDQSNVGDDSFSSYAKGGKAAAAEFSNYGNSFNPGSDAFKGYGEGSSKHKITFKSYAGDNTSFKSYAKSGMDFKSYRNSSIDPSSSSSDDAATTASLASIRRSAARPTNHWLVEPGKFFRERDLRRGSVMPMPDIRDKMPPRSFLPRSIASRIPFSAAEVRRIFEIREDTALGKAVTDTVSECERAPSLGETKRCATSAEDVIDFAVSVLGSDVLVRSTAATAGSKGDILIGKVSGVNGGKVTRSVSCHQSLFPYLVYYCHSVPKVRVYEAEILAVESKEKINQGVAICHLDTSAWSPSHGAFVALGSAPGKIEVCHWIFEGDMTWTVAD